MGITNYTAPLLRDPTAFNVLGINPNTHLGTQCSLDMAQSFETKEDVCALPISLFPCIPDCLWLSLPPADTSQSL